MLKMVILCVVWLIDVVFVRMLLIFVCGKFGVYWYLLMLCV